MRLSLTMIGGAAGDSDTEANKTWVDSGGTIGRAEECDWMLSDPGREISRCHARIRFMNDGFYLEDTSANGVFLNDRENRLNAGELHRLQNGERLFISDYQIAVQVDEDAMLDASADSVPPYASPALESNYDSSQEYAGGAGDYAQWDPLASLGGEAESDPTPIEPPVEGNGPHQSYLEEHFAPAPVRPESSSSPVPKTADDGGGGKAGIPADWWKPSAPGGGPGDGGGPQPPTVEPPPFVDNPQQPDSGKRASTAPSVDEPEPPHKVPSPPVREQQRQTVDAPSTKESAKESAQPDYQDALAVLLEGAGVNADSLSAETAEDLGRILRVTVLGVMDLLRARSELKNEFRMPATLIQARENNPLKFSTNAEDALHNLLVKHNPDYLGPVDAFEASFDDLRSHQIAMLAGMREAFMDMLNRFDPETLERQFQEKGQQGSMMGRLGRRRNWDMFKELFAGMQQDMDANFHRLFGESFIRAYEDRMARLQQSSNDNER